MSCFQATKLLKLHELTKFVQYFFILITKKVSFCDKKVRKSCMIKKNSLPLHSEILLTKA